VKVRKDIAFGILLWDYAKNALGSRPPGGHCALSARIVIIKQTMRVTPLSASDIKIRGDALVVRRLWMKMRTMDICSALTVEDGKIYETN
jgi:hypothetical protein